MISKTTHKLLALSMVAFLSIGNFSLTAFADEKDDTEDEAPAEYDLHISDVSTLISFAESCKKGSEAQAMSVILDSDVDLSGMESFSGIDSFSGYFNGNNHTVSGLNITSRSGEVGFFGYIEQGAIVENLTVDGVIYSTDKNNYVGLVAGVNAGEILSCKAKGIVTATGAAGGLVGLNGGSGIITSCNNQASVYSLISVGGIAGENRGAIESSSNNGEINADSSWLSLEDSSVTTLSIGSIIESFTESVEIGSDIGGIAGLHLGTISNCKNSGVVGYQHAGKNVGGIAGRFCGNISDCVNYGKVYGKQDVGGIAGQFEPRIMENGADLFEYIYELEDLTQKFSDDVAAATESGEDSLNTAADRISDAGNDISSDINETTDKITKSITDETNETKLRINKATESVKDLQNQIKNTDTDNLKDDNLKDNIDVNDLGNITLPSYDDVIDSISSVADTINSTTDAVGNYDIGIINGAIIGYVDDNATNVYNDVKDVGDDLTSNITEKTDDTSNDLRNLSDKVEKHKNILSNDITAINNKISDITSLADEQVDNLKRIADGEDIFEDYSAIDSENPEASRISNCSNEGYVNGDRNIGGIAGAIALEGTDSNDISTDTKSEQYILLAVLENSTSSGIIELRRENAGGIVGNSSIGLIQNCLSKNRIISEEGNYVGGVAGYAKGTVSDCASISVLEGSNYVGGIAGAAKKLRNCYSLVDISDDSNWAGEIMGDVIYDDSGDITISHSNMMNFIFNNYYVRDEFGGINNVSYNGIADVISYDTLKEANITDAFSNLEIYFYDSDYNLVSTDSVEYGQSISEIKFPSLTTDADTYLVWDGLFSDSVLGNLFLVAGDEDDVTVMESDLKTDGRAVAYAQGIYYESSSLEVAEAEDVALPSDIPEDSEIKVYNVKLVNTAADENMESKIRFYIGDAKYAKVYQLIDEKWEEKKDTKTAGSYVQSDFTGDSATFAVETFDRAPLSTLKAIGCVAIVVFIIMIISIKKNQRDNKRILKKQGL